MLTTLLKSKKTKKVKHCLPFFFTFGNALFGFLSVLYSLQNDSVSAAGALGLAICMDAFDGRIARLFNTTSDIGAQLDSLCDAVSFCFAPTMLAYRLLPSHALLVGIVSGFYLCSGLFRLARFNCLQSTSKNFIGLPTTAAAFLMATAVFYQQSLFRLISVEHYSYSLLVLMGILGILMVSTIEFYSFKYIKMRNSMRYTLCISLIAFFLLCYFSTIPWLLFLLLGYVIYSVMHAGMAMTRRLLAAKF